ncbi:MAG: diaminopimelate decarboxylase [Armatimonadota bacterium]
MPLKNKLLELGKKYGTPLYVYDADTVEKRYTELCTSIKWPGVKIFYAMKANYNFHILKLLKELGAGIDAVSLGEVILALKAGFNKKDILYTANNISLDEMKKVYALGVIQNIDALSSLEMFGKNFPGGKICVRFNTGIGAGEHDFVITSGEDSKFGIMLRDLDKVIEISKKYNLKVTGLHEHTGSGIGDTEKIFESMEELLDIASIKNFPHLEFIDFGGGFSVPYKPEGKRTDYSLFGDKTVEMFDKFCKNYGRKLNLYFEPGKYITAEAGFLIVRVNTIKHTENLNIAGTDSGFPHLIRPVLYNAYHHIWNLSNPNGKTEKYDIYGNICESGDFFAKERELPGIREGDYLAVLNAGAYCYSMGGVYNLRPMPAEVIIKDGKDFLARRALSYEELAEKIIEESG